MASSKVILTKDQKKAVDHKNGPLLVVAGAGTGKTRVITERIKKLIKDDGIDPQDILALTFTEKSAAEMIERLDDAMPLGYIEPWVSTFHSFADRLLKKEGVELGLDSSFKVMSYPQQWLLIRQNLFKFDLDYFRPLGNPTKFISAIITFISRLQDENISVEEMQKFANDFKGEATEKKRWLELATIYKNYEDLKVEHSKMDFGDLILWSIRLFKERPNILSKYQEKFKHVMVDEFQDTNYAQYELIRMLCPKKMGDRSLLVVGDDSQSIYKFRGAAISNILEFRDDYDAADMVTLSENFRSVPMVLDSSYELVQNNNPDTLESKLGISKKLESKNPKFSEAKDYEVTSVCLSTIEDEVEFVIKKIYEVLGNESEYTYKDIAILARANSHLDPYVFALKRHGMPYQLVGNRGLYDQDEVMDVIALLKVIVTTEDSISMYRVLNIDTFGVSSEKISKILSESKYKKLSIWEVLEEQSDENVCFVRDLIKKYQGQITEKTPTEFLFNLVHETSYLLEYTKEDSIENQLAINNLNLFLKKVKTFEVDYRNEEKTLPTVVDFLEYLELMIDAGENPAQAEIEDIDTINLLTVHASKGLEFPVVFMIDLVSDRFPTRNRKDVIEIPEELIKETLPDGDAHLQEERRLFYVGMTRAQKYLYLLSAENYGGKRKKKISGYVNETKLKTEYIDSVEPVKVDNTLSSTLELRSPKPQKVHNYKPYNLSYSKVKDFQTCPLKYKYKYILNVPTPPNHSLSFGITIHDTLRDYYAKKIAGESLDYNDLLSLYKKNWQILGYLDREHQNVRFESGKQLLHEFYEKNYGGDRLPIEIEKDFTLKIGGIKFIGRIDRIDPLPDGGVEIVDYKTGATKDQKIVDKDEQVTLYALAVKEAFGLDPKKLTYYYLEDNEVLSTTRSIEQLENQKEKIEEVVEEMKQGQFEAKAGMHCQWCDFKDICPSAYKG